MTLTAWAIAEFCTFAKTLFHRLALLTERMTSSRTCVVQHEMGLKKQAALQ
jgi:hypothetical protein